MTVPAGAGFPVVTEDPTTRTQALPESNNRLLNSVERLGNLLPEPALIFVGLIVALMVISAIGAAGGWSSLNPVTGERLRVNSLLSEPVLQLFITEIPRTYAGYAPLGIVVTIMLGAGVD